MLFCLIVAKKLESEGLIRERQIGVDPRSPGVGTRIRNEKYMEEKAAQSQNRRRPTSTAPSVPATGTAGGSKATATGTATGKARNFEVLPELKRVTALLKY